MKPSFAKTRLILSSLVVLAVGAVYVFGVDKIIIPTTPANHRATLVEVQLGM
ncbi:MAG: hypothetical protein LBG52_06010 [Candidatus Peribacteria bacterium]|jgi:hypothetical protein|nr:hypothetical protein [Candidatus Peribacteria bacterium]MDR0607857.1 hypothetical protein [Candidatus Peribacteria bacterium]